jgi:2-polyprenyl-3-methyl-5-hydroxy-6-metoxy-1,4-benzoquinol methylase
MAELLYEDSSRSEMLAFIPLEAKTILDIGCHAGAFGQALKARAACAVWGVEVNAEAAAIAAARLDRVVVSPFNEDLELPSRHFDVIVFNDVLEHLTDPWAALKQSIQLLSPGGVVVASLPNLRHIGNLLHILKDKDFRYEPTGIRDRTHLRFFTQVSAKRMFDDCGLEVVTLRGISETWKTPSIARRLAYSIFSKQLEDTKFVQFAVLARPQIGL